MSTLHDVRHHSHQLWETIAPTWERRQRFVEEGCAPVRRWMLQALAPQPGDTVLELAAGVGETGFEAAARVGDGGRVISSDFSAAMVVAARRRREELGLHNVEHRTLDAERLDLESDSVDGVICRYGYMLMADRSAALAETRRVLRPGGRLVLAVFGPPDRNPFFAAIAAALVRAGRMQPPVGDGPGIFSMAGAQGTTALLRAAGFADVRIEELPEPVFAFGDVDEYVDLVRDTAGPIAMALRSLSEVEQERLKDGLEEALAPFAGDGGYRLPGLTLAAVAS